MVSRKVSNKGISTLSMVGYFWKISLITVVFFAFYFLVKSMVVSDFDTSTVEAELFFYQTVYAKKGISYYDSVIDKVYPGKIDLARVKDKSTIEAELLQTFDYGGAEPRLAAKYILEDASGKELATWYYDEDMYDNLIAVAFGTGAGAAIEVTHSLYVIIIDEGKKRSGVLKASIVKQNS